LTETDCSRAEKACPQRLAIADLMTDAVRLLAQKPPGEGFLAGMRWF
jgi:predicted aldo/keto reductase-like oxidoreductase